MNYLEPRVLTNIDESYFIKPPTFDPKSQTRWDEERKQQLYDAYEEHRNPKGQYGFSKALNAGYMKMIKILHFEDAGHVVLPLYLLNHVFKGVYEEKNTQYKAWWDEFKGMEDEYKALNQVTYNHIFPDGRIIEYIMGASFYYKEPLLTDMFYKTRTLREYTLLKEDLEETPFIQSAPARRVFKV